MIQSFEKLKTIINSKPVLVLGKGPTFSRHKEYSLSDFITIGLNRVTDVISVDVAHCIDIDTNLCDSFINNSSHVLIPWHPHKKCKPCSKILPSLVNDSPILKKASKLNKLYSYNLSTWKGQPFSSIGQVIKAKFFSAEAIFHILCVLGVKDIFTLGIDGGNTYAKEFKHCKTFLNGRNSFDVQMPQLRDVCSQYEVIWTRL